MTKTESNVLSVPAVYHAKQAGVSLSSQPPLIQPKLIIGEANAPYEREAVRVADTVMRMPQPVVQCTPT